MSKNKSKIALTLLTAALIVISTISITNIININNVDDKNLITERVRALNDGVNEKFYFNRYVNYKVDKKSGVYHEVGFVEIYGTVIRIHKTATQEIFMINEILYDDTKDMYIYYSDRAVITKKVAENTITVHYIESMSGVTYYR